MKYALILLLLTGCASVKYTKDGEEETFVYKRWGRQSINGFEAKINKNGTMDISLEKQEGDSGVLGEALKNATGAAYEMSKKSIVP